MKKPLVTIICTCYNHQNYVVETLDSIKNQTYTNIEIVVVDDCSADNSVSVIKKWISNQPNLKLIVNDKNLGLTKSFNNAVTFSKGAYLMDLAADDVLARNCIEKLINSYTSFNNPNIGIIYSNATMIDENGCFISDFFDERRMEEIQFNIKQKFYKTILADSTYMCSISALYNRNIFEKLKGYDENLYFEDLDYWLRVAKNYKFEFIKDKLVHKRFLKNSMGNGFFIKSEHTKKLHTSFYIILQKSYTLNTCNEEHYALLKRIYKQSRWAIKSLNIKYLFLYCLFFFKVLFRIGFSK